MHHTVVHFEIPANDPATLSSFYQGLFGWKINKDPHGSDYWLIETAPEGQGVNGGMMKRQMPQQTPVNYILVESVEQFSKKVAQLGGKIVVPKQQVPGVGHFAIALDPDGNPFGLFENA